MLVCLLIGSKHIFLGPMTPALALSAWRDLSVYQVISWFKSYVTATLSQVALLLQRVSNILSKWNLVVMLSLGIKNIDLGNTPPHWYSRPSWKLPPVPTSVCSDGEGLIPQGQPEIPLGMSWLFQWYTRKLVFGICVTPWLVCGVQFFLLRLPPHKYSLVLLLQCISKVVSSRCISIFSCYGPDPTRFSDMRLPE